jgi:hypothetical protein
MIAILSGCTSERNTGGTSSDYDTDSGGMVQTNSRGGSGINDGNRPAQGTTSATVTNSNEATPPPQ